ncbi:MAG TPA: hypothetical protein PKC29_09315 [Thermodesulfobacteriota bacterium]|nr:hypothetical protein [Thermodesulfobacteriota bacterium]
MSDRISAVNAGSESEVIHIADIDEKAASLLLESGRAVIGIRISLADDEGNISVSGFDPGTDTIPGVGVDFDLSPCECAGLEDGGAGLFLSTPVHTSSAREFFDLMLSGYPALECLVSFTGNAWKILATTALKGP